MCIIQWYNMEYYTILVENRGIGIGMIDNKKHYPPINVCVVYDCCV